ncbi:hypothetical protein CRG98_016821, partial [Punica granatum]
GLDPEEQLINNLFKALRVKARAKMIMTETRGSEGYAQNYPANSARSKYSESPKKQKKALEAKDASQPAEQPLAMTPPPTLLTPNKVNKMIEECFPEIEKKRMGVPVFNSNVALPLFAEIQATQLPPKFSFLQIAAYEGKSKPHDHVRRGLRSVDLKKDLIISLASDLIDLAARAKRFMTLEEALGQDKKVNDKVGERRKEPLKEKQRQRSQQDSFTPLIAPRSLVLNEIERLEDFNRHGKLCGRTHVGGLCSNEAPTREVKEEKNSVMISVSTPFGPTGSRHEDSRPKLGLLFITRQSEANARMWEHGLQKGSRVLQKAQKGNQKGR